MYRIFVSLGTMNPNRHPAGSSQGGQWASSNRANDAAIRGTPLALNADTVDTPEKQLRFLLNFFDDFSQQEIASCTGIDIHNINEVMAGTKDIPLKAISRIKHMYHLTMRLRAIMDDKAIVWWFRESDPELRGKSPMDLLHTDDTNDPSISILHELVDGYFDPSYS